MTSNEARDDVGLLNRTEEEDGLDDGQSEKPNTTPFVVSKLLPLVIFIIFYFNDYQEIASCLTPLCSVIDFFLSKVYFGDSLIGIKWFFSLHGPIAPFAYEARPDPFVPRSSDSNLFWTFIIFPCFAWFIFIFVTATDHFAWCISPLFCEILSALNTFAFIRCAKASA